MGHAGLKDKHAKTTQTFSIPLGRTYCLEKVEEKLSQDFPELKVNSLKRREKKTKRTTEIRKRREKKTKRTRKKTSE